MNYIWDLLLAYDKKKVPREVLIFKMAEVYSAYMEIAFVDLNDTALEESSVEINPYYRFQSIFRELFDINYETEVQLRAVFFDLVMHHLGEVDLKQGLCKIEYYKKFMLRDILQGIYGIQIQECIQALCIEQQEIIADALMTLYQTGSSVYLFKKTVAKLFKQSIIYTNQDQKKEILIYLNQEPVLQIEELVKTVLSLFLPIDYEVILYWQYHFGILGVEETMQLDAMVLY